MSNSKNILVSVLSGGLAGLLVFVGLSQMGGLKGGDANGFWGSFDKFVSDVSDKTVASSQQENLVVKAVEKAGPAVVSVIITKDVPIMEQYYDNNANNPFGGFPGFNFQMPQYRQNGTEKKEVGGGSGFIVSEDGYIVTNKHVVSDEKAEYTVITSDKKKYDVKVLAKDPLNDVAILKIEAKDLPTLEFANSEKVKVGQSVIAIGNPLLQFSNSVSVGVVSGLSRSITATDQGYGQAEQLEGVIQTDAAINPGNSGGPLLNLDGKVVGVNVATSSAENISFSLPSNMVKGVFESVKETGKIVRPYLGLRFVPVSDELKTANKLTVDYGVLVSRGQKPEDLAVLPGSPSDKAGLLENDIILEVDGVKLDDEASLAHIVALKKVGDKLQLKVLSKGKEKMVEVTLESLPE